MQETKAFPATTTTLSLSQPISVKKCPGISVSPTVRVCFECACASMTPETYHECVSRE